MQSTNSEYVTSLSLSVALYTVKKNKKKNKRVCFNPYKVIYSGGQSTQIKYLSKSTDTYNKILLQ